MFIKTVNLGESGEVNLGENLGEFGDTDGSIEFGDTKLCEFGETNELIGFVGDIWGLEWFP